MASIPNLNTLRRARGGPRLRGGRGRHAIPRSDDVFPDGDGTISKDRIIQQTDNDATSSRISAVELGYLQDEYAKALSQPGDQAARRFPIMNRGTYVRTSAIDRLVAQFLRTNVSRRKQIVSLGAGSDTRFFRLCKGYRVTYHELDFRSNVDAKRAAIESSTLLSARLESIQAAGASYHLHAIDLRDLAPGKEASVPCLDTSLPTLIVSECCLCYLPPTEADAVVSYFLQTLTDSVGMVIYEPTGPFDAFGRTMVSNLASRGIHLQTLEKYATLESQRERLRLAGLSDVQSAMNVLQIYESEVWVLSSERERVERLEWLDEVEEWNMLASHYCVTWASRGDVFTEAWLDLVDPYHRREPNSG